MDNHIWGFRENIRYISIFLLVLFYIVFPSQLMLGLLCSWVLLILVFGNVRLLSCENKFTYSLRMTMYFLPYLLPSLIFLSLGIEFNIQILLYCLLVIFIFTIWLIFNLKSIRISFADEVISSVPKEPKYTIFLRLYNTIGAAICEEYYFRGFILSIDAPNLLLIFISTSYFMLSHYILPWSESFTKKDHFNQLLFGFISSIIFILSGSILPSILLHLLVNSILGVSIIRSYERHYVRKDYFDKLLREYECFDELEI